MTEEKFQQIANLNQSLHWTDYSVAAHRHLKKATKLHNKLAFETYEALRHLSNSGEIEATRAKAINDLLEGFSLLYYNQVESVLIDSLYEPLEEVVEAAQSLQEYLASWDEDE